MYKLHLHSTIINIVNQQYRAFLIESIPNTDYIGTLVCKECLVKHKLDKHFNYRVMTGAKIDCRIANCNNVVKYLVTSKGV